MRTLIVLCASKLKFLNKPSVLEKHPSDGQLLGYLAIKDVFPETYDRIIYTFLKTDNVQYNIIEQLNKVLPKTLRIETFLLDRSTSGPAETAYLTIKNMNVKGEVCIRDSHNYIKLIKPIQGNCIAGIDLTTYDETVENLRRKSFLVLNEQNQVLDIVEKSFRSDVISVGLYNFKDIDDFLSVYEHLITEPYPIEKLYISHIISYLIGYKGRIFREIEVKKYEDWGCMSAWKKLQKQFATYFIDVEMLMRYSYQEYILEINELNKRQKRGALIVAYGGNGYSKELIYEKFSEYNIVPNKVLLGINESKEKVILHSLEEL